MSNKITIEFNTQDSKQCFTGWLLDGGGYDDYDEYLVYKKKGIAKFTFKGDNIKVDLADE